MFTSLAGTSYTAPAAPHMVAAQQTTADTQAESVDELPAASADHQIAAVVSLNFTETPSTEGSSAAQPAFVASNAQSTTNPAATRLTPRTAPADASVSKPAKGVLAPLHGSAQQSTAADTPGDVPKPPSPSPATASLNIKGPMTAPVSTAELIIAASKRFQPVNRQSSTPVTAGGLQHSSRAAQITAHSPVSNAEQHTTEDFRTAKNAQSDVPSHKLRSSKQVLLNCVGMYMACHNLCLSPQSYNMYTAKLDDAKQASHTVVTVTD